MRPTTRNLAALVVVGAVAFAGCGSSSGSSSSGDAKMSSDGSSSTGGKKIDVCKIITADDAATVVGGTAEVQAPSGTEGFASGVCIYRASGGGTRVRLLQVRVYPGPQFYGEKELQDTEAIEIRGADKAFVRSVAGGKSVDVQFVKAGKTGVVNFTDTGSTAPGDGTLSNVEDVARKLAAAL